MKMIIDVIIELLASFFLGLESLMKEDMKKRDASFGNPTEILSSRHKGWCIDGKRRVSLEMSRKNLLVVGGSGSGKSQTHIFPLLLHEPSCSIIANDNSGELSETRPYLISRGIPTEVLDIVEQGEVFFNPIEVCKGDIVAIRKVSKTLMQTASQDKPDFFTLSNILQNCFLKCYYGGQEKKAFELEQILGTYSQIDETTNHNRQIPLLSAFQIREMENEILVLISGKKPLKVKTTPAYRQRRLQKRLETPLSEGTEAQEVSSESYEITYLNLAPTENPVLLNQKQMNNYTHKCNEKNTN